MNFLNKCDIIAITRAIQSIAFNLIFVKRPNLWQFQIKKIIQLTLSSWEQETAKEGMAELQSGNKIWEDWLRKKA